MAGPAARAAPDVSPPHEARVRVQAMEEEPGEVARLIAAPAQAPLRRGGTGGARRRRGRAARRHPARGARCTSEMTRR